MGMSIYVGNELGERLVRNWSKVESRLKAKHGQVVISALRKYHSIVVVGKDDWKGDDEKQIILITTHPFGTETVITRSVFYQKLLEWAISVELQKTCKVVV